MAGAVLAGRNEMARSALQVQVGDNWEFVAFHNDRSIVTTNDKRKSLDRHAKEYFERRFSEHKFRIAPREMDGAK